ncbi:uncharacterized protein LOC127932048 isoform X21 [Oncorhynchus keta]|uniref:uncharacterized protein LOC127932048 isoform X21 n=1 Tax=Oncorhynchus keta TaxID=8018 RepID=UPI00227AFDCF|nr:uncharacterized protein LOC127932048 isoform X21 [Oncorhynchus keta]
MCLLFLLSSYAMCLLFLLSSYVMCLLFLLSSYVMCLLFLLSSYVMCLLFLLSSYVMCLLFLLSSYVMCLLFLLSSYVMCLLFLLSSYVMCLLFLLSSYVMCLLFLLSSYVMCLLFLLSSYVMCLLFLLSSYVMCLLFLLSSYVMCLLFTFTFKSFSRRSYPERLTNWCIHLMTSSRTVTVTISTVLLCDVSSISTVLLCDVSSISTVLLCDVFLLERNRCIRLDYMDPRSGSWDWRETTVSGWTTWTPGLVPGTGEKPLYQAGLHGPQVWFLGLERNHCIRLDYMDPRSGSWDWRETTVSGWTTWTPGLVPGTGEKPLYQAGLHVLLHRV